MGWDYWPIDLISNLFWIRCISPNSAGLWFKSVRIGSLLKGQADKKTLLDINFNIAFAANAYEDDDDNSDDNVENTSRCTRTSTGQTPGQMRSQSVTSLGWAGIFATCILESISFGLVCFLFWWKLKPVSWDIFASGQFWSRGVLRSHGQSLSILASGKEDVCVWSSIMPMQMMIMISMVVIMIHLALGLEVFI